MPALRDCDIDLLWLDPFLMEAEDVATSFIFVKFPKPILQLLFPLEAAFRSHFHFTSPRWAGEWGKGCSLLLGRKHNSAEEGDQLGALRLLTALPGKAHSLRWGQRMESRLGRGSGGAWKMTPAFCAGLALPLGDSVYFPGLQPGGGDKSCRLCFFLWAGIAGSWQEVHRKTSLPNYLSVISSNRAQLPAREAEPQIRKELLQCPPGHWAWTKTCLG